MSANHRFSLTANACAYPLEVLAFSGDEAISTPSPAPNNHPCAEYAELAHCGPVLTVVEPNSALAKVFAEEWQEKASIWLESDADEATLVAHLRSLIHVRLEGEVSAFFRYYDPCITRLWLEDLTTAERDRLMGPVCLIRLPDGEGGLLLLKRESLEQDGERYGVTPWLKLSAGQLEHLCKAQSEHFMQCFLTHCQRYFPQCLQELDSQAQQRWALGCQRNAARQGYSAEDEVMAWSGVYAAFGDEFPKGANQEVYRQLLSQRDVSPAQRLELVLSHLISQLAAGVRTL